jgi:hypothetical protein
LGLKREELTGELRKLHCEELYVLYFTPNIIRVIKSRRMGWVGHVTGVGMSRGEYWVWRKNLKERDHLVDTGLM